jgi:hypothetical protein
MTRRSDMMLEDLFDCKHEPEIPVTDDSSGEIIYWLCRCGQKHFIGQVSEKPDDASR